MIKANSLKLSHKIDQLHSEGSSIIPSFYMENEIDDIVTRINRYCNTQLDTTSSTGVYAIRQLIDKIPELTTVLFNSRLKELLQTIYQQQPLLIKSIYFDKPEGRNWFVPYHQDLSITVKRREDVLGFSNWTIKKNQTGVQPPVEYLQNTTTIRIHLDHTSEKNGALRVIPKSHLNGVVHINEFKPSVEEEHFCPVPRGGIMLMKPLTFHASGRSESGEQRRVIHLEFSTMKLPQPLKWSEATALSGRTNNL